ncbi:MAG TPA: BadF/BadG/BcrA/BcrD ATPase family protein [Pyrinomonadaceae bacterium]|jgi:N-acetylglucosamine kinase-like BadF-type ATPase|nr:BadF/BadG/BcrA/BcrD ATPase family protein [Pyrinomonadaceae bacterium]
MKARGRPVKFQPKKRNASPPAPPYVLGVDGGGTKTRAVVADSRGEVIGHGHAGPSNPLRVGVSESAAAVREAVERACLDAKVRRQDLSAAEVGLAGVKRDDIRERMRAALSAELGIESLEVVTDAVIALYGATEGKPGLVVIAGTGSICCGVNARGRRACAGGWGPVAGDEGSGSWIARRALQSVARATDGRGRKTSLTEAARDYFKVERAEDLSTAVYAPNMTNNRIAGFGRHVIDAARRRDPVAREIVDEAGRELARAASAVVKKLKMEREPFQLAYVGGVFAAGNLILEPLREELGRVAPRAFIAPPVLAPAEAAARMASEQVRLALAG